MSAQRGSRKRAVPTRFREEEPDPTPSSAKRARKGKFQAPKNDLASPQATSVLQKLGPVWSQEEVTLFVYNYQDIAQSGDWKFLCESFPQRTAEMLKSMYETHRHILPIDGAVDKRTATRLFEALSAEYAGNDTKSAPKKKRGRPAKQTARRGSAPAMLGKVNGLSAEEVGVASSLAGMFFGQEAQPAFTQPKQRQLFPKRSSSDSLKSTPTKKGRTARRPSTPRARAPSPPPEPPVPVTDSMSNMASQIRNLAKNPLSLKWCLYEFFYSPIDRALLVDENLFDVVLREKFPNMAGEVAFTKFEWFYIKQRLGRPRRFSKRFLAGEKSIINMHRNAVRGLQTEKPEAAMKLKAGQQLPQQIPVPMTVGQRVVARAAGTKGLVYPGYVLAVQSRNNCYRVDFDRDELGIRSVRDLDLAPIAPQPSLATNLLMKEKVHVPSAGITERPRNRRASIAAREKSRKDYTQGASAVSAELFRSTAYVENDSLSARKQMNNFLVKASSPLDPTGFARCAGSDSSKPSSWSENDLQILAMVRKVLRLKEALLAAQNTMNGIAQRLRAEGGTVDEAFTQQYAWLIDRIGAVDSTLKTCFETINSRKQTCPSSGMLLGKPLLLPFDGLADKLIEKAKSEARRMHGVASGDMKGLVFHADTVVLLVKLCLDHKLSVPDIVKVLQYSVQSFPPTSEANRKVIEQVRLAITSLQATLCKQAFADRPTTTTAPTA